MHVALNLNLIAALKWLLPARFGGGRAVGKLRRSA